MPAKTYVVASTKGGVGKSTTTANLSAVFADMGKKSLLIDCDPQQSTSRYYRVDEPARYGLSQVYRSANTQSCISKTYIDGLDIILNDDPKTDGVIANFLRESVYNFHNLWAAINDIKDEYDYVFIDTRGSKCAIADSAMLAADIIISPLVPSPLETREFLNGTLDVYRNMQPKHGLPTITGRPVPPLRVLMNMADKTNASKNIMNSLRQHFDQEADGLITVLNTRVPAFNNYKLASGKGVPVHRFETSRKGSSPAALEVMTDLVWELEPKLSDLKPTWEA